jgi:outer membrane protein OmpA-like peptidoglycan-associated protein
MKKIVRLLMVLFLSAAVFTAAAQQEENVLREAALRNTSGDNWFISLSGNANLLVAEQDGGISFDQRIRVGGAFTVGKWFTPNLGARMQVMGGALRGFNYAHDRGGKYIHSNFKRESYPIGGLIEDNRSKYTFVMGDEGEGIWQDFNYGSATFDLMMNISNLMRGYYKDDNLIDIIPFAGIGAIYAFDNGNTTPRFYHFAAKLGLRVNFNVSKSIAIYLEPTALVTDHEFDGYVGESMGEGVVSLGLGVQYTFNRKFTNIALLTADEIDRLNRKINEQRYLIENHQTILERQQDLLDKLEQCCDEDQQKAPVSQIIDNSCLPDYVRFALNSHGLEASELRKIRDVAEYLKRNPDSKLLLIGYADRQTGNPRINLTLSQQRVEVVLAEFKREGLDAGRFITEWRGDREQPFPPNEWNRAVVMVERQ